MSEDMIKNENIFKFNGSNNVKNSYGSVPIDSTFPNKRKHRDPVNYFGTDLGDRSKYGDDTWSWSTIRRK